LLSVMAVTPFLVPHVRADDLSAGFSLRDVGAGTGLLLARALMADLPHTKLFYKNPIDIHGTAATIRVPIKSATM
jgi:hypothetical protein